MDRCPQCSFPTLDHQQLCVACGETLQMTPIRVDGRPMPAGSAHTDRDTWVDRIAGRITATELALMVVLGLLVATLSLSVLT